MNKKSVRRPIARALALACGSVVAGTMQWAHSQDTPEPDAILKIEVTGSHIPRSDAESALPVQVITREDIERSGSTTVAEVMAKVSANVLGFNDQLSVGGIAQPGLSSVNLRGIGDGSTLVLLNGRRVANYAFNGGTVDVNSIPLSAVDRIEILKDGASAIYGADAIAGVVNFILRKDFQGLEITGNGSWTQHGGGDQQQAVVTAGYGDLTKDRFNVFVTATYEKDDALLAAARPFSRTGYLPGEGVNQTSPAAFPANILAPTFVLYNPAYATGCAPPTSVPTTAPNTPGKICGFDFASLIDDMPAVERTGVVGRGTWQLNGDHQLFAEALYASNKLTVITAPTPAAIFDTPNFEPILYPAGGPYYPTAFAAANGISGDLSLLYRTVPLGPQIQSVDTQGWRVVIGAEGLVADWNYVSALTYSRNNESDDLTSGFVSAQRLIAAMATGLINPFGPSGSWGTALLDSTQVTGKVHFATGTTVEADIQTSKELFTLPGGPFAIALGAEARREKLDNEFTPVITSGDVLSIDVEQQTVSGSRSVQALYAEASVPFAQDFEAQVAARYDHYSDFGGTVNPKIALRWQPMKTLLLRTSWGTGFRAPALYDLFTPQTSALIGPYEDTVRCPVTGLFSDCVGFFKALEGGNPNLKPETSEQFNAGLVWDPTMGLSLTVDYWKINKANVVNVLDPDAIFANLAFYGPTNIVRGPVIPAYPNVPGPIQTVELFNQNLGDLRTSGIDVDVAWHSQATSIGRFSFGSNGTYLIDWKFQPDGLNYVSGVGQNCLECFGPLPRWKNYATLGWQYGSWGATLAQTYQSGYEDTNSFRPSLATTPPRRVSSYEVWDIQGRFTGFRNTTVVLGIKNLMDRAPPFTNQPFTSQVGYDPTYGDPLGRSYYVQLTFSFK